MITKNAKKLLAGLPCAIVTPAYSFIPIVDQTGATCYFAYTSSYFPLVGTTLAFVSGTSSRGFRVGSGTTPATENDYNLESQITSGVSGTVSVISRSLDANGNPVTQTLITVSNNTSSTDITIGEIGYFETVKGSDITTSGNAKTYYILIDRVVLDTPITIPAKNSATITYSFKGVWNSQS